MIIINDIATMHTMLNKILVTILPILFSIRFAILIPANAKAKTNANKTILIIGKNALIELSMRTAKGLKQIIAMSNKMLQPMNSKRFIVLFFMSSATEAPPKMLATSKVMPNSRIAPTIAPKRANTSHISRSDM